jgi:indolepyruvate ferredoxin oxidoreductase
MTEHRPLQDLSGYRLADRYAQTEGRVFMTGTQALLRIVLDQARRDRAAGLNTGGFVNSGKVGIRSKRRVSSSCRR